MASHVIPLFLSNWVGLNLNRPDCSRFLEHIYSADKNANVGLLWNMFKVQLVFFLVLSTFELLRASSMPFC